jgi:hypothetical protein
LSNQNLNLKKNKLTNTKNIIRGKFSFVDLAGSERVFFLLSTLVIYFRVDIEDAFTENKIGDIYSEKGRKKENSKNLMKLELANINKSLFTLGSVIKALTQNNSYVPYRESKLTSLLKVSSIYLLLFCCFVVLLLLRILWEDVRSQ